MNNMIEKQYTGADGVTYTLYKPQQTPAWAREHSAMIWGDSLGGGSYITGAAPSLDDYDGTADDISYY